MFPLNKTRLSLDSLRKELREQLANKLANGFSDIFYHENNFQRAHTTLSIPLILQRQLTDIFIFQLKGSWK